MIYNLYCDESCHLENDEGKVMVLGTVWCPKDSAAQINEELRKIKERHKLNKKFELKWVKVSSSKKDYYFDVVEYFFSKPELHFRGLVIQNKDKLRHSRFGQDHNTWYYKMYFLLISPMLEPKEDSYNIYLDIKDTQGVGKVKKLHEILCNKHYDFDRRIISKIQPVRSNEIEILQVTDLLIGALSYKHRGFDSSAAKMGIIEKIKELSGYNLDETTLVLEKKFNLFFWSPREDYYGIN